MAIALIGAQNGVSADNQSAVTASFDTSGASLVVIGVAYYGNDIGGLSNAGPYANTFVSDNKGNGNPVALTDWRATSGANLQCGLRLFYYANPIVGAGHTFTGNYSSFNTYPAIAAVAFSGVTTSSPFNIQNGNNANGSLVTSVNVGSLSANASDVAITMISIGEAASGVSVPSGFTFPVNGSADYSPGVHFGIKAGYLLNAGTVTNPSWSGSTQLFSGAIAAFIQAAGATVHPWWQYAGSMMGALAGRA